MLTTMLTPRQKAAVIVRLLLAEGGEIDLNTLPPELQDGLADEMAQMDLVDRPTRDSIVAEFCEMLENIGISFPGDMDGTLAILGDKLSPDTTDRLRRMAAMNGGGDPWLRIGTMPVTQLVQLAQNEATEIVAVMFSKLPVPKAAEIMQHLPEQRARAISFAMSMTGGVQSEALRRIGRALVLAAEALPRPALEGAPVEKVGAILNFSPAGMRESVLTGLDEDDPDFARDVRKAIFTWINIPQRIDPRDIPRVIRECDQQALVKALAGSTGAETATVDYILGNLGSRMAGALQEEISELGKLSRKDAEDAMSDIINRIRSMEDAGELFLIAGEASEEEAQISMKTA
ncbi:MAG: FliG C-terminal domain-containing protein [Paracoccus sp. (in: a-proteobacteria)]|uniref:flagellar motor switch protein FliG n=1 Tax=Paracoccus sp. TaxID=267 RepID=UPI0026E022F5|nr:FliG C-terminal domain-containing protein [Paracoccus sp. (in: a-proteobacteria)]MDO5620181.1 FliG C-terminal domain-containing protein [Paracoccus sp. (in: a-proteobacteria)]